ncbi:flagellar biosynthesis protein FlhB [[Clostridium] polysaccharolyticum]|uniref:Flagellar biosynthetic protein FlhB n=1 Tax=[Clostridium] polysaccharolyticum TaxID=29364 RepID=A0A1H9Y2W9_9FIRM|nr:flagellar biosynthesis protein FlhB [[Clostridium] polysaccharolyticum]SES63055.1 flagellar biosynthetic protein FlhB [[Clostridium] polysaccharolyticum]
MNKYLLSYNLQLFAKEGVGGEKTEEATPKKLEDARKKGQVAKSTDIVAAFVLLAFFLALRLFVGWMGNSFMSVYYEQYHSIAEIVKDGFTINRAVVELRDSMLKILLIGLPIFLVSYVLAVFVNIWQVKWKISAEPLKPKLNKINPITGFKKIFSKEKIFEFIKSLVKLLILGSVVYSNLKKKWGYILQFYDYTLQQALSAIGSVIIEIGLEISIWFLILSFADLFYQKRKFAKEMRMTKQEIKDEYKNTEGDPQIKGKIRQKMREVSRQRMMQAVPDADVVITNPTHLAVAIKYDKDTNSAPVVVAKGADYVAGKIKEIARENEVEIVENKPLARMIYFNVELGDEIPQEMYQMVAEVLAYVYRLKNKQ